ncbi:MAG: Hsp70 family protein, partial [Myxococcales bacterium]|nr:Hsp70 family protein [Myxococcales bacterium]
MDTVAAEPTIGIDLGTTHCVVATVQQGKPTVVKNQRGDTLTPSVIAIGKQGRMLFGQVAKMQAVTNPLGTVYASKRLLGRRYSSPAVQAALPRLGYEVVKGERDEPRVRMGGRDWSIEELTGALLGELKRDAEAFLGKTVTRAVITVPAYFNDRQRQATRSAAQIAGLEVLRIINEPTAAALAYASRRKLDGKVAVFDLGGGTFDVSVLEVREGIFEVNGTGGDSLLGGEDFDQRLASWLAEGFKGTHGVDLGKDQAVWQRLREASERAKISLSAEAEAQVNLPFVRADPPLHLLTRVRREDLERVTADLCERLLLVTKRVLEEANVAPDSLAEVILVGGMTRMPLVAERVRGFFGREPSRGIHPEEAVALGAAIHAWSLVEGRTDHVLLDVTSHSLGVATADGRVRKLIPRNAVLPAARTQRFSTSRSGQTSVTVVVVQGEAEAIDEAELLGEFALEGLRPAPAGDVEVDVTFEIDAEGLLCVSARDADSGRQQSVTAQPAAGLAPEELKRIIASKSDSLLAPVAGQPVDVLAKLAAAMAELRRLLPRVTQMTAGT